MTNPTPSPVLVATALDLYIKALGDQAKALRSQVHKQMLADHDERKAAVLPDGVKIGSIGIRKGSTSARVTNDAALLRWVVEKHPEQIMQAIRPAFVAMLLDASKKEGIGYDPTSGEILDFIEVTTGPGGITITTTPEGKDRMAQVAGGFAGMLTAPPAPHFPDNNPYKESPA